MNRYAQTVAPKVIINVGYEEVRGMCGGTEYVFPPRKGIEIQSWENRAEDGSIRITPAAKIAEFLMQQLWPHSLVYWDQEEAEKVGVEEYIRQKKIEGYRRSIAGSERMLDEFNKLNRDLAQRRQPPIAANQELAARMEDRDTLVQELRAMGVGVALRPGTGRVGMYADIEIPTPPPLQTMPLGGDPGGRAVDPMGAAARTPPVSQPAQDVPGPVGGPRGPIGPIGGPAPELESGTQAQPLRPAEPVKPKSHHKKPEPIDDPEFVPAGAAK